MGYFKDYYGESEEKVTEAKEPLIKDKVTRGFDSAIGSLKEEKIDLEEKITDIRVSVANGDISDIKHLALKQIEIEEIGLQIAGLVAEKNAFLD